MLITGGEDSGGPDDGITASAEIYDPSTGKFSTTGSMHSARVDHAAALLPDGRVLIVGGLGCAKPKSCMSLEATNLASAEIYDPGTGKFNLASPMLGWVDPAYAITLNDRRVLVFGSNSNLDHAQLYDPSSGKFEPTGATAVTGNITLTLLADGKVFMTGLDTGHDGVARLFDPGSGEVTTVPFTTPAKANSSLDYQANSDGVSAAALLRDGRVLLYGGGYLETYDPTTGAFAPAGQMLGPGQWWPVATLLADGDVLFEGGELYPNPPDSTQEVPTSFAIYDPASGVHLVSTTFGLPAEQTATLLGDGSVLVAGFGYDGTGNAVPNAALYKP